MSDELLNVVVGDETQAASLDDIAGVDMNDVEEYRGGEPTPEGVFEWRIKGAEMGTKEVNDKDEGKVNRAVVLFELEAIACRQCKDTGLDPAQLVGTEHNEMFFIKDLAKDLGRLKAFMQDMGLQGAGPLKDLLAGAQGHEFVAAIRHRKDKNDASRVYANIDFKTVSPMNTGTVGTNALASGQTQTAGASAGKPGFALKK